MMYVTCDFCFKSSRVYVSLPNGEVSCPPGWVEGSFWCHGLDTTILAHACAEESCQQVFSHSLRKAIEAEDILWKLAERQKQSPTFQS